MFIFDGISMIILYYCILIQSTQINKIPKARIPNATSTLQFNCSSCICQCLTNTFSPSSSLCCYVNCFVNENTCQVIVSPAGNSPNMIIDQSSVVYRTNCFNSSSTRSSGATSIRRTLFTSTMITSTGAETFTSIKPGVNGSQLPDEQVANATERYALV